MLANSAHSVDHRIRSIVGSSKEAFARSIVAYIELSRRPTMIDYFYRAESPDWPIDGPDHVYLARACAKLGSAMFGEKWGLRVAVPEDDGDDDHSVYHGWEVLDDQAEIESERMMRAVQDQIVAWARSGRLKTALRARVGGALVPQSADIWNTERYRHRFAECEMSPSDPFRISEDGTHFIFVEMSTFEACLKLIQEGKTRRKKPSPVEEGIIDLLLTIWPEGVPDYLGTKAILNQIVDWKKRNKTDPRPLPKESTFKRALKKVKRS